MKKKRVWNFMKTTAFLFFLSSSYDKHLPQHLKHSRVIFEGHVPTETFG